MFAKVSELSGNLILFYIHFKIEMYFRFLRMFSKESGTCKKLNIVLISMSDTRLSTLGLNLITRSHSVLKGFIDGGFVQ